MKPSVRARTAFFLVIVLLILSMPAAFAADANTSEDFFFDISPYLLGPTRDEIKDEAKSNAEMGVIPYSVANTPKYPYHLTWPVNSLYYYLDSSVNTDTDLIHNAGYNWVYTGYGYNNIYPFTQTTNISNSAVDVYMTSENYSFLATTMFYKRVNGAETGITSSSGLPADNWLFAKVHIVTHVISQLSRGDRQATICHEFGHCLGLAHYNNNPYSIMCQYGKGRAVVLVQECDHNSVKELYV